jgi:hypothetical protein
MLQCRPTETSYIRFKLVFERKKKKKKACLCVPGSL